MADNNSNKTVIELGTVIKNRGEYSSSAKYYKDNVVQYQNSSYIVTSVPQVGYLQNVVPTTPNSGWSVFAYGAADVITKTPRVDVSQSFTDAEKKQVRANIGLGNGDIDNEPTAGSGNLVKSGGVKTELNRIELKVEDKPIFITGKYINKSGVLTDNASFQYSLPFYANEGDEFTIKIRDGNGTAMICATDENGTYYNVLVLGQGLPSVIATKTYIAQKDGYLAFSGYITDMNISVIRRPVTKINWYNTGIMNISELYPTDGIDGTNRYSLELALSKLNGENFSNDQCKIIQFLPTDAVGSNAVIYPKQYMLVGFNRGSYSTNYLNPSNWVEIVAGGISEINISEMFPTGSSNNDDIYTLQQAIEKIPIVLTGDSSENGPLLIKRGFRITFNTSTGVQTWVFSLNNAETFIGYSNTTFLRILKSVDTWVCISDDSYGNLINKQYEQITFLHYVTNYAYWSISDNIVNKFNQLLEFSFLPYGTGNIKVVLIDEDALEVIDSIVVSCVDSVVKTIVASDFNIDINNDIRKIGIYLQYINGGSQPNYSNSNRGNCTKYILSDMSSGVTFTTNHQFSISIKKTKYSTIPILKTTVNKNTKDLQEIQQNIETIVKNSVNDILENQKVYTLYDAIVDDTARLTTGWTLSNGVFTSTAGGWSNMLLINREYFNTQRKIVVDFDYSANNILYVAFLSNNNARKVQQTLISVDFSTNTFNLHQRPFEDDITNVYEYQSFTPSSYGTKYRVEIMSKERGAIDMELYDMTTGISLASIIKPMQFVIPEWGLCFDKPFIFSKEAGMAVSRFQVLANYENNIRVQVIGDSITQGYYADFEKDYTALLASVLGSGKVVRSGRSGGTISNVMAIIESETTILKPEYVMVTIGTNGGNNSTKLNELIDSIVALGCKPILNHIPCDLNGNSIQRNQTIDGVISSNQNKVYCTKMDIATAQNYNPINGYDNTLFYDGIHPNNAGHNNMFQRIKIDIPELFG